MLHAVKGFFARKSTQLVACFVGGMAVAFGGAVAYDKYGRKEVSQPSPEPEPEQEEYAE